MMPDDHRQRTKIAHPSGWIYRGVYRHTQPARAGCPETTAGIDVSLSVLVSGTPIQERYLSGCLAEDKYSAEFWPNCARFRLISAKLARNRPD